MRQLSSKLENWLKEYNKLLKDLEESGFKQTPTNAREGLANLTESLVTEKPVIKWIQDDLVESEVFNVPVRIYHPQPESHLPVLLFFHGGGHMSGSITVYDPICRKFALATNHVVVSLRNALIQLVLKMQSQLLKTYGQPWIKEKSTIFVNFR